MLRTRRAPVAVLALTTALTLAPFGSLARADTITFDLASTSTISISDPAAFTGSALSGRLVLNTPGFAAVAGPISVSTVTLDFGSPMSFPLTLKRDSPILGTLNAALTTVALQTLPANGTAILQFSNLATSGEAMVRLFVMSQDASILVTLDIVGREVARVVAPEPASAGMFALGVFGMLGAAGLTGRLRRRAS